VPHGAQEPPECSAYGFVVVDDSETQLIHVVWASQGFPPPDAAEWQRVGRLGMAPSGNEAIVLRGCRSATVNRPMSYRPRQCGLRSEPVLDRVDLQL